MASPKLTRNGKLDNLLRSFKPTL